MKKTIFHKIFEGLFNTRAGGLYILLFAAAIGTATFIENDFGTSAAQKVVFKTRWFELLLILFSISIVNNVIKYRMLAQKKWALLLFHLSMLVILLGAGITRYFGYEGIMHIRENDASNTFVSADTYLRFEYLHGGNRFQFDEGVLFASLGNNSFEESYALGNQELSVRLLDFIPNPVSQLEEAPDGRPTLKLVFGGASGREEYFIGQGTSKKIRGILFSFGKEAGPGSVELDYRNDSLLIRHDAPMIQTVMATQTTDTLMPTGRFYPLRLRSLYALPSGQFVFGDFHPKAVERIVSADRKVKNESLTAVKLLCRAGQDTDTLLVYGQKGVVGRPDIAKIGGGSLAVSYGAKPISLPFSIKLYDFIMERYPGTNSAASYASEVQLIDDRKNLREDHRIFMNNILDYEGYRFFQSSFDQDEKGTYLSVNYDFWGTWISYLGYALLTIGLILVFFSKNTRFHKVLAEVKRMRSAALLMGCLAISSLTTGQKAIDVQIRAVDAGHADLFSKILVQDHKGRMKPMHTLTREVMRKVARKEKLIGQNADQVVLGMFANRGEWISVPMIKITDHKRLHALLGTTGDHAAYKDFFEVSGAYKLRDEVRRAYGLQPIDRGAFEKDIMKIDERVNIVSMIYSGRIFRIIPIVGDSNNTWVGYDDHMSVASEVADKFFPSYQSAVANALLDNDYSLPNQILAELKNFQTANGKEILPSAFQARTEIALNNWSVFNRLAGIYALLGLAFLILLFISVFKPGWNLSRPYAVLFWLTAAAFAFHTLGLGMRWYVSERAPWSNGYESMIYIGWTTTLAGLIFTRKSLGGLAATTMLAGTILLVAMLSYLDPEITPLVPVLKSYWLTIHVSLEAGSYGFLMLGAIMGLINLLLFVFITETNKERLHRMIKELTLISELTIMGGLVMISIGTYLGGVWANESWGRYWGWDAKETWALVTILVYAFILHMRLIPGMKGLYAFNLATLFGWASVVMTYFGVNYYLSGLHSYAAGDPIPIPNWVYYTVASVFVISLAAYWRKKKLGFVDNYY